MLINGKFRAYKQQVGICVVTLSTLLPLASESRDRYQNVYCTHTKAHIQKY